MRKKIIKSPIKALHILHASSSTGPNNSFLSMVRSIDRGRLSIDAACPPSGYLADRLDSAGIKHVPLIFSPGRDILTLLHLISILRKGRYHVLNGHMGRTGPLICIAGKICRIPVIILTEHMNDPKHSWVEKDPAKLFFHGLWHLVSNNALDKVIAVSNDARENYIKRQGISEKKVIRIYNSVYLGEDCQPQLSRKESLRRSLGFKNDDIIIGAIGRLVKEKGYDDAIMAVSPIVKNNPRARFLIIGDGPEMGNLKALARRNGIEDKVVFPGFRNDTNDLIGILDIFIHPPHSLPPESFGRVLIEAMASHVPVICSDINPFKEIVKNGQNGLLFKEGDISEMSEKMTLLLENKKLAGELTERAYGTLKEKFSSEKIAKEICDLYEGLLLSKGYSIEA